MTSKEVSLADSWLKGVLPPDLNVIVSVTEARKVFQGWGEQDVREVTASMVAFLEAWERNDRMKAGAAGESRSGDSIETLMALLADNNAHGAIFDEFFSQKVAGLILREASNGNYQSAVTGGLLLLMVNKNQSEEILRHVGREYDEKWLPHMVRGWRIVEDAKKGHEAVHGTAAEKLQRWDKYQVELEAAHERHPERGIMDLQRIVARCHGVSLRTVQRHTSQSW